MAYTYLGKILRRTTVGIRGLNDANTDLFLQASGLDELYDKCCDQCGDLVAIQHVELAAFVQVEVHQSVSITIETATTLSGFQVRGQRRRKFLLCLDEISTTLVVEDPQ